MAGTPTPGPAPTDGAGGSRRPRRTLALGPRTAVSGAAGLLSLWRRSLQFRVVAITLVLGTLVLAGVGSYLYQRVADGLVEERRLGASAEVVQLVHKAQLQLGGSNDQQDTTDGLVIAAKNTVQSIAGTERSRYVVLARTSTNTITDTILPPIVSGDEVGLISIPPELQEKVAESPTVQQTQIITLRLADDQDVTPAWVIGQQITVAGAGPYALYFIYPMTRERDTLSLVGRTFLVGGIVLMFLIVGISFVVTRIVVAPVRRAAEVAERFASGELSERMTAKGEDDLARLALAFNGMAASLQQQIAQLENLSRFQQRFVSDVSHELRTPLTTIRMAGDLIHDSRADFDPTVSRSAELLHNELDRFESLLTDLLEISRFDAGAAVLDLEPTDLRRSVARVVDANASLAERRSTRIDISQPDHPCEAEIDSRRVERIIRNLLVNAIEHGEGRPIEVTVAEDESAVAVSVRDHGLGLRPGEGAMVFNRFWRADPARARTTGGTGLGLAISLEDARLHDGWLQAWGAPGQGSCFRLTLPKVPGQSLERSPLQLNPLVPARPGSAAPVAAAGGPGPGGPGSGMP
ncbi:MAG: MtrAB system histidine kinase MtrB, partial [Lapillicoccus sp.]